jgi:hypothetical protein
LFDAAIQGRTVLGRFAPPRQAGKGSVGVSRKFRDISSDGTLTVTLVPREGKTVISGIEIVTAAQRP